MAGTGGPRVLLVLGLARSGLAAARVAAAPLKCSASLTANYKPPQASLSSRTSTTAPTFDVAIERVGTVTKMRGMYA